jgi:hypothetical protein
MIGAFTFTVSLENKPVPPHAQPSGSRARVLVCSAGALALAVGFSGCDVRSLTGPPLPLPTSDMVATSESSYLGGTYMVAPATSHPSDIHSTTPQPLARVPANTWVVIHASGTVSQVYNPACNEAPPYWQCGTGDVVPPFAEIPSTLGPVEVFASHAAGGSAVLMRGNGERSGVGLYYSSTGAEVSAKLTLNGRYQFRPGSSGAPTYFLSGGFSATATAIDAPLRMTESSAGESGARRYTVEALHGLQFVSPPSWYWPTPPGAIGWWFFPGENVSDVPAGEGHYFPINACAYQATCEYLPTGPGRVQVVAYVEGKQVVLRSRPTQESTLELTCPGPVKRGEEVTCTATPSDRSSSLTIVGWSFDGVERTDGDPTEATWGGTMVQSGTVEVRGRIGTDADSPLLTARAEIVVTDRTWPEAPVIDVREVENGTDDRLELDNFIEWAHDLGGANFFRTARKADPKPDPIGYVSGGPNDDRFYFEDLSFPVYAMFVINRAAMRRGSGFYNAQERDEGGGGTRIGGMNWCTQRVVTGILPGLVEAHELRHISAYEAAFRRELALVIEELERTVGTYTEIESAYEAEYNRIDAIARRESWDTHTDRQNPNLLAPTNSRGRCALKNERGTELRNRDEHQR